MPRQSPVYSCLSAILSPPFQRKMEVVGAENLPPQGSYIIAANHTDWLDGFFLAAAVGLARKAPLNFLTKSNYYWWTTAAIKIPPARRGDIIDVAAEVLRNGKIICNFPEGQRNDTDTLLPGKTGTVRMAALANVPVVPAGIIGDSGRTMWQSVGWLFSNRHRVRVRFGQPVRFTASSSGNDQDGIHAETRRLMAAIAPLCEKRV